MVVSQMNSFEGKLSHEINASIAAPIVLGFLCLQIKVDYDTFIYEDVHQSLGYQLILLAFARIFLFTSYSLLLLDDGNRHFKDTETLRNIHASAIVALIIIQICLGVSELMNYEQIHDGVWMAMFHTGYHDHKRQWDELMRNFNCCGVYGSDKWDRFEFPCLEPGVMKVGCPELLISHLIQFTHVIGMSLLIVSIYQLHHVMAIKKRLGMVPPENYEERRKLIYF